MLSHRIPALAGGHEEVRRRGRAGRAQGSRVPLDDRDVWTAYRSGTINTHSCDPRHGTFGYGLAIAREHWRKGYASEAICLVLAYYFRELRYQKVTAHVYAFNEASIRLHEKLGFQLEGRLRRMIFTGRHVSR